MLMRPFVGLAVAAAKGGHAQHAATDQIRDVLGDRGERDTGAVAGARSGLPGHGGLLRNDRRASDG